MSSSRKTPLEEITQQALVAAERGQWDLVRACYERRSEELPRGTISACLAKQLMEWDRVIQERAFVAQAAVIQALGRLDAIRATLKRLRSHAPRDLMGGRQVDRHV